jgi:hypothetical protein
MDNKKEDEDSSDEEESWRKDPVNIARDNGIETNYCQICGVRKISDKDCTYRDCAEFTKAAVEIYRDCPELLTSIVGTFIYDIIKRLITDYPDVLSRLTFDKLTNLRAQLIIENGNNRCSICNETGTLTTIKPVRCRRNCNGGNVFCEDCIKDDGPVHHRKCRQLY